MLINRYQYKKWENKSIKPIWQQIKFFLKYIYIYIYIYTTVPNLSGKLLSAGIDINGCSEQVILLKISLGHVNSK